MENQPNYIRSISLENVRCFGSKQTLYFTQNNQSDGEIAMWNVILGNNGTGKTTVLKSIVNLYKSTRKESELIALGQKKLTLDSRLQMCYNDEQEITHVYNTTLSGRLSRKDIPRLIFRLPLLFAYGAARKIGTLGISEDLPDYTYSLFDEQTTLLNAEKWLIDAEYLALKGEQKHQERYELVKSTLQKLLKEEVMGFEIKTENNVAKVYFKTHYGEVRLHELSLGYKTLIAWVTDLASGLIDSYFISENPLAQPAICLVDEIDLHMHPQMQRNVMKFLRETFPKTQFICTAHSPLIVQSGEDANIILLRRKGDEVEVVNDVDDAKNWRIDQILDSDLFENTSSYAPSIQQKVNKRRAILLKDKPSKREKAELSKLDDSLDNLSVTESPEYLQALKILSKVQKKMVRIDKSKVGIPTILHVGGKGEIETQKLIQLHTGGKRDFKSTDFLSTIYGDKTVKNLLLKVQQGKCCFCEQKRPHGREGDVEHFRPKTGFQIDNESLLKKPGYYWLAYHFDNLFYACKVCNQEYKKNYFPLIDETKRAFSHNDDWKNEDSLILHPEFDNPADHIEFVAEIAKPKDGSPKGKVTIELVGLNDPKLVEQRFEYLKPLKILAIYAKEGHQESQDYFKEIGKSGHQFSLMVRCNFPDLV